MTRKKRGQRRAKLNIIVLSDGDGVDGGAPSWTYMRLDLAVSLCVFNFESGFRLFAFPRTAGGVSLTFFWGELPIIGWISAPDCVRN